ncbi:DUF6714 family protein [Alienimonas sp. DA493]|uniref:DUF6714 family protein n=1 Tax=Alienimonas sp. DA493 TaxID=3373605 RepID=UPI0037553886
MTARPATVVGPVRFRRRSAPDTGVRDWLLSYIDQAFRDVSLELGMTIYAGEAMDRYGDDEELRLSRQAERQDWRRVPPSCLHERPDALCYLDASAFRFYTPAIMSTVVRGEDLHGRLTDVFLWRLHGVSLRGEYDGGPYRQLFNRSQRAAVVRFLKYLSHNLRGGGDWVTPGTVEGLKQHGEAAHNGADA